MFVAGTSQTLISAMLLLQGAFIQPGMAVYRPGRFSFLSLHQLDLPPYPPTPFNLFQKVASVAVDNTMVS